MPANRYYIESGDSEKGPLTLEQLQQDADPTADTLVRGEGGTERRPLGDLLAKLATSRARDAAEARRRADDDQIDRSGFCKRCFGQTTSQSPWNISTFNGFGTRFYGAAEKCRECYSVVRALWVVFAFIPVIPLGTYRYQFISYVAMGRRFIAARQTRKTRWSMVFAHWLVLVAVVVVLIFMRWDVGIHDPDAGHRPLTDDERAGVQKSLDQARRRAEVAQKAWRGGIEQAVEKDVIPKIEFGACPVDVARPSTTDDHAPIWLNRMKGPLPDVSSNWTMNPNASSNWTNSYEKSAEDIELILGAKVTPETAARLLEDAKRLEVMEIPWEVTFLVETEVEPVARGSSYDSGIVAGRTYLYDYRTKRVECAGRVLAKNSDRVNFNYTELLLPSGGRIGTDQEFWLALKRDLRISTYRQVADSMRYRVERADQR